MAFLALSLFRENHSRLKNEMISARLLSATLAPTSAPSMLKIREMYGPTMGSRENDVPKSAATTRPKITPMDSTKISLVGKSPKYVAMASEKCRIFRLMVGAASLPI